MLPLVLREDHQVHHAPRLHHDRDQRQGLLPLGQARLHGPPPLKAKRIGFPGSFRKSPADTARRGCTAVCETAVGVSQTIISNLFLIGFVEIVSKLLIFLGKLAISIGMAVLCYYYVRPIPHPRLLLASCSPPARLLLASCSPPARLLLASCSPP
eukprot:SAG11_NODE_724_length_7524_cov_6.241481_10_plen_154_part_01